MVIVLGSVEILAMEIDTIDPRIRKMVIIELIRHVNQVEIVSSWVKVALLIVVQAGLGHGTTSLVICVKRFGSVVGLSVRAHHCTFVDVIQTPGI